MLIALDGSQPAEWAVRIGRQLAGRLSANVMLVHVIEFTAAIGDDAMMDPQVDKIGQQQGKDLLSRTRSSFPPPFNVDTRLRTGFAADQIAAVAIEWNADLIVMGSRGRGRFAHFVLGSTTESVSRESPCPVMTVSHEPLNSIVGMTTFSKEGDWIGSGADSAAPLSSHAQNRAPGSRDCDWCDGASTAPKHLHPTATDSKVTPHAGE